MKVDDIHHIDKAQTLSNKTTHNVTNTSFQQLLESKMQAVSSMPASANIADASKITANVSPEIRLQGLSLTEKIVSTLDSFEKALLTNSFEPADLEPFIASLEEQTAALLDLKNQLNDQDPLAQLLDDTVSIAYIETFKFRRGDYSH